MEIMTFLNQITIKADVEKEKFFRYANYTSPNMRGKCLKGTLRGAVRAESWHNLKSSLGNACLRKWHPDTTLHNM